MITNWIIILILLPKFFPGRDVKDVYPSSYDSKDKWRYISIKVHSREPVSLLGGFLTV